MNLRLNFFPLFLLDLFFPNQCLICHRYLPRSKQSICSECQLGLEPTELGNWIAAVTHSEGLDGAYSGWFFNEQIQKVIHSLKYEKRAKLGIELGIELGQILSKEGLPNIDLLVPVPLHPVKKRDRGYNQAEWIAKGLSDSWAIPFDTTILKRKKNTKSQTTLTSEERKKNVEGAFLVLKRIEGMRIGVVDDVLTTGSTISACAIRLKAVGVKRVVAITCSTPKISED